MENEVVKWWQGFIKLEIDIENQQAQLLGNIAARPEEDFIRQLHLCTKGDIPPARKNELVTAPWWPGKRKQGVRKWTNEVGKIIKEAMELNQPDSSKEDEEKTKVLSNPEYLASLLKNRIERYRNSQQTGTVPMQEDEKFRQMLEIAKAPSTVPHAWQIEQKHENGQNAYTLPPQQWWETLMEKRQSQQNSGTSLKVRACKCVSICCHSSDRIEKSCDN